MNKLVVLLLVTFTLPATAAAQQLSVEDTLALRDRAGTGDFTVRAEWNALTYYLQGAIEGIGAYQQTLIAEGHPALFCPPPNKTYSVDELFRFLNKSSEADRSRPASLIIVEAYAAAYPCDR